MVLRSRRPSRSDTARADGEGEGAGGARFLATPSSLSRALPLGGLLTMSLTLSAMLVVLVTLALTS